MLPYEQAPSFDGDRIRLTTRRNASESVQFAQKENPGSFRKLSETSHSDIENKECMITVGQRVSKALEE
jgi:hypothetical protein